MTKHIFIALALGGCATLPLAFTGCSDDTTASTQQQQEAAIKTCLVQQRHVTDYGEWFSYLHGQKDTDIHPRVSGFLVAQEYKDGTLVKEGDVLFRIDPDLYQAELAQAKANLQAAEASLVSAEATRDQAQLDVTRYEQLVKSRAVSEKDLTDARQTLKAAVAAVDAGKASVNQLKAAVKKAQINLDYTVVKAPYDGIIGTALASQGDLVGPSTKLANITSADPIRVDFSVNSDRLIDIFRKYRDFNATDPDHPKPPPFELLMEDDSTYPLKGTIKALESKVADSGLIDVVGEIANPDHLLRGGMSVRVRIPLAERDALLVPKDAIRNVMRNSFIIVVDKKQVPHTVPVSVLGSYDIDITEADGYSSAQSFVAIGDYNEPLAEIFRKYGYENATEVPVVADADNGVRAMSVSSANSRLPEGATPGAIRTQPLSFRPVLSAEMKQAAEAAASGKKTEENPAAKATLPPFPVKVANLLQQDVEVRDEWFGTLRGVEETDIRPKVSGFLLSQNFADGALVKAGDVLYTIDPAPYEAERDEAQANLEAAKASKEQAQAKLDMSEQDLARYRKLSATSPGAISDKTLTDAETAVQTNKAALLKADATIAQMEAALNLAEINLGYTTVTAPFSGRAGIHKASIGALVSSDGADPLVTLSSVDPIRVDFNISGKTALAGLAKFAEMRRKSDAGQAATTDDLDIVLEDGSVYPSKGHVVSADNALSKSTGTLKVVAHVDNVDGGLRSGMPVRVRAGVNMRKGAFLVPARAPLSSGGKDLIVVLRPDNAPAVLPISKGEIVNIPVKGPDGKDMTQPMQIVHIDRSTVTGLALALTGKTSLEDAVLSLAGVKDWKELLLKKAEAADARALLEKQAGAAMPDDAPAQAGVADWDALLLQQGKADNFRELFLKQAGATDEVDLVAKAKGYSSPMEMALKMQGIPDISQARVVVEGSIMAAQTFAANQAAGAHVNKLTPVPFQYTVPQPVVPSVTADAETTTSAADAESHNKI